MTNRQPLTIILIALSVFALFSSHATNASEKSGVGYYQFPAIHNNTIVFTSEGDLWKTTTEGGLATRLTSHPEAETDAHISPDGQWVGFTARYEGTAEVYVMPIEGGLPKRLTYIGESCYVVGWTADGKLMFATRQYSTLPRYQIVEIDIVTGEETLLPLAQARYGSYDNSGALYFTRHPFQGAWANDYQGGLAQNVWRFVSSDKEATNLTAGFDGTSYKPLSYDGRIYFLSDRDRTMNIWSMLPDGADKKQHTNHDGWEVQNISVSNGKIVYHVGADLHLLDLATNISQKLAIRLASDFDQQREKWIDEPMDFMSQAHLSADGDRVVMTARGQVFVAPVDNGRLVQATRNHEARYREAIFMPDGKTVLALSDETGELEFWSIPINGVGDPKQLTDNGTVLRWKGIPSRDGKLIAYDDKDQQFWIYDTQKKTHTLLATNVNYGFEDLAWSPDSRWLAYVTVADNYFRQVKIYNIEKKSIHTITSDRFHSFAPAWSPDGGWLYFISDRNYNTIYGGVWGTRQQEPFFDKTTNLFALPLNDVKRSPFLAADEVSVAADDEAKNKTDKKEKNKKKDDDAEEEVQVKINFDGIENRLIKLPVPAGEYSALRATDKQLIWLSRPQTGDRTRKLQTIEISDEEPEVTTLVSGLASYELSANGKKILIKKSDDLYVFSTATSKVKDLDEKKVDLSGWTFALDPKLEWRQMFKEAWRLHRDYFYDRNLLNLDWQAKLDKYLPLVDRVSERGELSNLLGQMVAELKTMHTYVYGGDFRGGPEAVGMAALGAKLDRVESGYQISHIYQYDLDYPDDLSPLARADLDLEDGDIILAINGVPLTDGQQPGKLLRNKVGQQILLSVKDKSSGKTRNVVVEPISNRAERTLRYNEWEYTRRLEVEKSSDSQIGYVHLQNTRTSQFGKWARDFYPVFKRQGLIIDNRHNSGGNMSSWMVNRLIREAWSYWEPRVGAPESNMQYAFLGHVVVLCNEHTVSDGELFTEGLKRMVSAKVIGTRTLGGEVWLTSSNRLVDNGIATAAEFGVFGPEGEWLIEGHGIDPDLVVENLPRATFDGHDAQLEAAIKYLKEQIKLHPVVRPKAPPYPDMSGN